jgi:hypothetical protein
VRGDAGAEGGVVRADSGEDDGGRVWSSARARRNEMRTAARCRRQESHDEEERGSRVHGGTKHKVAIGEKTDREHAVTIVR